MIDSIRCQSYIENPFTIIDKVDGSFYEKKGRDKVISNLEINNYPNFVGNYKNLRISLKGNYLSFSGSLTKFSCSNNIQRLKKHEIKDTFSQLSNFFKLSYKDIQLTRLDIGENFIMDNVPQNYLQYFIDAPYFKKDIYDSGNAILYYNKERSLSFYDKILEMTENKQTIPTHYKDSNVLRYEARFLKRLKNRFKRKITFDTLLEYDFWDILIEELLKSYKSIDKINEYIGEYNTDSVSQFNKSILTAHINTGQNATKILSAIGSNPTLKGKKKSVKYKMKSFIKRLTRNDDNLVSFPLIQEFETKLNERVHLLKSENF